MLGIGLGLTARRPPAAAWTPASLTGLAATLLPAESRSAGLLWQNSLKTTPATADGDPVRLAVCPYTGVEFTAASDAARPLLYSEGSGKWSLSFDGVDDLLSWTVTGWTATVGSTSVKFIRPSGTVGVWQTAAGSGGDDFYRFGDGKCYLKNFRTARLDAYGTTPDPTSTARIATTVSGASAYRFFVDGSQVGADASPAWATPSALNLCQSANVAANCRVSALIVAAAEWNSTTRGTVETYLGAL